MKKTILQGITATILATGCFTGAQAVGAAQSKELNDKVIMLDAGHGGSIDIGCQSKKLNEATISYRFAKKVKRILEKKGATVVMTRGKNEEKGVSSRIIQALDVKPDYFISFHTNCASPQKNGTQTFFSGNQNEAFATSLQHEVSEALNTKDIGVEDEKFRRHSLGVLKQQPSSDTKAALIELGFLTNEKDAKALINKNNQKQVATAISNVLKQDN